MIQELHIRNFKSFKEHVVFSFEATDDKTFEDYHVVEVSPGVRLLRFAMVYGANASGKSNLLDAFEFLENFLFAKHEDVEEGTGVVPFRLDRASIYEPTEFTLVFYVGSSKYVYSLKLTTKVVLEERLDCYISGAPENLFSRTFENGQSLISFNQDIDISAAAKEAISLRCLPNMSFFAAKNQVNIAIDRIDIAKNWLRNSILPKVTPSSDAFYYASSQISRDDRLKSYLLDFISKADFNISNMKSIEKPVPYSESVNKFILDESVSDDLKEKLIIEQAMASVHTDFEHTVHNERGVEIYSMKAEDESAGTRRIFGVEAAIYEALENQGFIFVDEIEASLHPDLVEYVIQHFLSSRSRAQLLVTTHYDQLLCVVGNDLIRKDSVWFTEKTESGSSDLYSLVEYKDIDGISSLQRAYRNGVFGALPNINE